MSGKHFTEAEAAKIVRFHGEGLSAASIAYLVGRSPSGVSRFLRRRSLRVAPSAEALWGLSEEKRRARDSRIVRDYSRGLTSGELAKEFGLSDNAVRFILEREGVERRPTWLSHALKRKRTEGRPVPPGVSEQDLSEMVRLYVDLELSSCEIAKRLGRNPCQVRYHLAKAGVRMRSWEEAQALRLAQDQQREAA